MFVRIKQKYYIHQYIAAIRNCNYQKIFKYSDELLKLEYDMTELLTHFVNSATYFDTFRHLYYAYFDKRMFGCVILDNVHINSERFSFFVHNMTQSHFREIFVRYKSSWFGKIKYIIREAPLHLFDIHLLDDIIWFICKEETLLLHIIEIICERGLANLFDKWPCHEPLPMHILQKYKHEFQPLFAMKMIKLSIDNELNIQAVYNADEVWNLLILTNVQYIFTILCIAYNYNISAEKFAPFTLKIPAYESIYLAQRVNFTSSAKKFILNYYLEHVTDVDIDFIRYFSDDDEDLNKYSSSSLINNAECNICLLNYIECRYGILISECGHTICTKCLSLYKDNKCWMCRRLIKRNNMMMAISYE